MNAIVEPSNVAEQKKQIYLHRVNQLYTQIRFCLQNKPLILENYEVDIIETLGHYKVPKLSIKTKENQLLAEFNPSGASILLAEGAIDVEGCVDRGYLLYMLKNNPQTFFKVEADDWYWIEARINVQPQLIKRDQILQIITYVSDYEF
jgi:hypothetical protein